MVGLSVNRHMEDRTGLAWLRLGKRFDRTRPQYHETQDRSRNPQTDRHGRRPGGAFNR
jgi:hypothetical protein